MRALTWYGQGDVRVDTAKQALMACRKGGTLSVPGVYAQTVTVPFGAAMNKGLTFKMGQTHIQRYLDPLMQKIRSGEIDPSFVITHTAPLEDAAKMYGTFRDKEADCVKVVLKRFFEQRTPPCLRGRLRQGGAQALTPPTGTAVEMVWRAAARTVARFVVARQVPHTGTPGGCRLHAPSPTHRTVKLVGTQLAYFFRDPQARQNVRALLKYVAFVLVVVVAFAEIFHLIMVHVEGVDHSWVTGLYWTLTVMSTLGFGDITFQSDLGRVFSLVVLLSGIVLLLIVLPFAFIRFFYAPWLEAQIRTRAPRKVPAGTSGHAIICAYDTIAPDLIARLKQEAVPYFVLLSDAAAAAELYLEGVSVVAGDADNTATWEKLGLADARLVFANRSDVENTNITLTAREIAPDVPIVAVAGKEDSVDVLELSGANHVLPLKTWLGEQLASRVDALRTQAHTIGRYRDLLIAELPVHHTPLVGKTIRESRLREIAGVSIIGVWERGRLQPARPDLVLNPNSVPVLIGTEEQFETLDDLLMIYGVNPNPVLVLGGGTVGRAATRALQRREVPVHLVEQSEALCERLGGLCQGVFAGDAADYALLKRAGIMDAPSVLLTTNDDAVNIYLASYCRHLNPELRIVSRITHGRNSESIHRAGADFVLSYDALGVSAVLSVLQGRELVVLGEGIDLFSTDLPRSLWGRTLAQTGIGAKTGLNVIAVQHDGELVTNPPSTIPLERGAELVMLGDAAQRQEFVEHFGK